MSQSTDDSITAMKTDYPVTQYCAWLNHASHSPETLLWSEAERDYYDWDLNLKNLSEEKGFAALSLVRTEAARMLGTSSTNIAYMHNTTCGLNAALNGIDWHPGDKIIITSLEFPAIPAIVHHIEKMKQIKIIEIEPETWEKPFVGAEKIAEAVDSRTRAVAVSWVQFFNGYKLDLEPLREACLINDALLVVDGIQGVGALGIDVRETEIDVLTAGGQKWLLSPKGTGLLYLSNRAIDVLKPPAIGWLSMNYDEAVTSFIGLPYRPVRKEARVFETGTLPYQLALAFGRTMKKMNSIGVEEIEKRIEILTTKLTAFITEQTNEFYTLKSVRDGIHDSGIVSFSCSEPEVLHALLIREKIVTSLRENTIRISPHFYNSENEIERLLEIMDDFSKGNTIFP